MGIILLICRGGSNSDSWIEMFQHWDLFNSETLVGQNRGLESLAGILQVASQSFHVWWFIHERNYTVAPCDPNGLPVDWRIDRIGYGMGSFVDLCNSEPLVGPLKGSGGKPVRNTASCITVLPHMVVLSIN